MDTQVRRPSAHEGLRMEADRAELLERIARAVPHDGSAEPLPGLLLHRASAPTSALPGVYEPAFCVIAQGSKEVYLGRECYRYDPYHYCLSTVELPVITRVVEASRPRPYLSLRLALDPALVGSVMLELGYLGARSHADAKAFDVSSLDADLLNAVVRLLRLIDHPNDAAFMASLVKREIIYRLLMGQQGERLWHIVRFNGDISPISKAIELLRKNFHRPLAVHTLAREVGMSVSGFYQHFKAVTSMSPLQFQKQLRLQEARRLMLYEGLDAASAGYRVGYNSPSHFNRDYKRLFGFPPHQHRERLQGTEP
ncbi:transcriptional regulator, AraC family [Chthonomonas calidirosea]|uniref:Transcriptional regulator, AraC family n=1 Tax=Chthonomonas calidirosea (strain DSM 23976 / ICMP 18418 / T49) TaxID=1303518 RepID=S0EXB9_CHTCT|nr:AraC family transcriptional regulator [Chthonomonas calidirosea]CCW36556.1 transcriptional regulator, AraC family [Chthonomonas calidirosea T49]CEK16982.1 transcriptional regulator, AraC family [Chthonomonas calidirosea]